MSRAKNPKVRKLVSKVEGGIKRLLSAQMAMSATSALTPPPQFGAMWGGYIRQTGGKAWGSSIITGGSCTGNYYISCSYCRQWLVLFWYRLCKMQIITKKRSNVGGDNDDVVFAPIRIRQ
jgi:hypothetical protein